MARAKDGPQILRQVRGEADEAGQVATFGPGDEEELKEYAESLEDQDADELLQRLTNKGVIRGFGFEPEAPEAAAATPAAAKRTRPTMKPAERKGRKGKKGAAKDEVDDKGDEK